MVLVLVVAQFFFRMGNKLGLSQVESPQRMIKESLVLHNVVMI